jgi:hypothetical protein
MADYEEPPAEVVARLRPIGLGLPDAYEEKAWVGTRWCVRKRTFAHVLAVHPAAPPTFIADADLPGDDLVTILTFRSSGPELEVLMHAGHPYFYAGWGRDVVGMVLEVDTDWDEIAELVTESYCVLAPQKLVALVDRPTV